jgi:hypothetical protein
MGTIYSGQKGVLGIAYNGEAVEFGRELSIGEKVKLRYNKIGVIAEVLKTISCPDSVSLYKIATGEGFVYEYPGGVEPI